MRCEQVSLSRVQQIFKEQGCELLSTVYTNSQSPLDYVCSCGNKSRICWSEFRRGKRCRACSGSQKKTLTELQTYYQEQGCELLATEYKNAHCKLKYRCICGTISEMTWVNFKNGSRCSNCSCVSKGEKAIKKYLDRNSLPYTTQHTITECKHVQPLPFDFKVNELLIEFQGIQHYKPKSFGSHKDNAALEYFKQVTRNDKIKRNYCQKHNIPLLVIPYSSLNKIDELLDRALKN